MMGVSAGFCQKFSYWEVAASAGSGDSGKWARFSYFAKKLWSVQVGYQSCQHRLLVHCVD